MFLSVIFLTNNTFRRSCFSSSGGGSFNFSFLFKDIIKKQDGQIDASSHLFAKVRYFRRNCIYIEEIINFRKCKNLIGTVYQHLIFQMITPIRFEDKVLNKWQRQVT